MVFIHRFFVANLVAPPTSDHQKCDRLLLAAAAVFLSGKLRNTPFSLKQTVSAYFSLAKEIQPDLKASGLTPSREASYRFYVEKLEM